MSLTRDTINIYWRFTRKYLKQHIVLLILRPVYLSATYVANIFLAGMALDRIVQGGPFEFWRDFGGITIGLIICGFLQVFAERTALSLIWRVQNDIQKEIARYCYDRLVYKSAAFHADHFAGSLVSQTNKFIAAFERLHDTLYWQVYSLLFYIIATFTLLTWRLPVVGLVLAALVFVYLFAAILSSLRSKDLNAARSTTESDATGQLADTVGNILAVKSFGHENFEKQRYEKNLQAIWESNNNLRKYVVRKDTLLGIPVSVGTVLAIILSVMAAQKGLAPASTVLLASTLSRDLLMRCREFNTNVLRNISRAFGDAQDMTKILMEDETLVDPPSPVHFKATKGEIVFKNVTFDYENKVADQLFESLNLTVKPGEKVGLVGPSGGGKTTVTKLLLRFMDIQGGSILIDGQNIAASKQKDVRQSITYVPQEPLLFHRSLSENIAYGQPDPDRKAVIAAARKANAHEFIDALPKGYDTLVGERGIKLSGGQRQRIAIARAMLKDAPIVLLDEATSALDSQSEILIQEALWELMKNKTSIVIAHRLSTIMRMDRIIVLDNGNIVEEGNHKQLIKHNGLYARLWAHQSGGFLEE